MSKAKVIELSDLELIDIVDRYEYLSTLLNSKITPNINRLEKLENEKINIDILVKELTSTKEFLGKLSTNLSNDAKQKIETYLNNKVVEVLKNAFENNEILESNISKIADNSLFFKQVLESDQKHLRAYKKIVGYKALILSSIIGIFLGFFASIFFYKYHEISNRIENFSDLYKAINEKRIITMIEDSKTILVYDNKKIIKEGDFIDDIKVVKITDTYITFYSFRDGTSSTNKIN
ncbi:hypothetical protein ACRCD7_11335 [Aliarcobacter sp. ERUVET-7]|uniref:hypothetical protein n=1 Tax=Aliarcobacter TaxID=2321111 RepID=UPI002B247406|nr:hypothetical protein [Aliarcobacter butzleri]